MAAPRILVLDIETAPALAFIWRLFKENVGVNQLAANSEMMSYAAKWLGEDAVIYDDARHDINDARIVEGLSKLLEEADFVVAHNGRKFDLRQIRGRAVLLGIKPFPPVKVIDTFEIAKKEFGFLSNSLAFLTKAFGVEEKLAHKKFPGFELWAECIKGNMEAWEEMRIYNIGDIISLEQVYLKMRGWATDHPNVAVFMEATEKAICPKCGSDHLQKRGFHRTNVSTYQRFSCNDCGGWSRSRFSEGPIPDHITYNAR